MWKTMETAPMDGMEILGLTDDYGVLVLFWNECSTAGNGAHWADGLTDERHNPTRWTELPDRPKD